MKNRSGGGLNEALAFSETDAPLDGKGILPCDDHLSGREKQVMAIALTVTAKRPITLRKEVLRHLGVQPGDKLSIDLLGEHRVQLRPKAGQPVSKIFGLLKQTNSERLTIEEIEEAAAAGWAGEE